MRSYLAIKAILSIATLLTIGLVDTNLSQAADIDITAYGAMPGGGDDRIAIQNAINAANSGDRIIIPAGTFHLGGTLTARPDISIVGAGRDSSVLEYVGFSSTSSMIELNNGSNNVELAHFTLDGFGTNANGQPASALRGIRALNSSGHYIHNLRVRDLIREDTDRSGESTSGIRFSSNVTNSRIVGNEFINIGVEDVSGTAVRGNGSGGNQILNNTIQDIGRTGVHFATSPETIVRGNTIRNTGLYIDTTGELYAGDGLGVELFDNSDRSIIEDNVMDRWLSLNRTSLTAVRRNTVVAPDDRNDTETAGLELAAGTDNVYTDNHIGRGSRIGLLLVSGGEIDVARSFIGRNDFVDSAGRGAQIHDGKGAIRQIYFYDNEFSGSTASDGASSNTHAGIRLLSNKGDATTGGIQDIVFESNRVIDNQGHGFRAFDSIAPNSLDRLTFFDNVVTGNTGNAFDGNRNFSNTEFDASNVVENNGGSENHPNSNGYSNIAPDLSITGSTTFAVGEPIDLSFVYSDDASTMPSDVLWDLDAGLPQIELSPSYAYESPGQYNVTLIAWDNSGRAARSTLQVNVVAPLTGDFNGNGVVDAADYTLWRDTLGSETDLAADASGNGMIDAADYDLWVANFGNTSALASTLASGSAQSTAVPEPGTLGFAGLLLTALARGRRRFVSFAG